MKANSGVLSTVTVALVLALTLALPAQAAQSCESGINAIRMELDRAHPGAGKSAANRDVREAEAAAARRDERACVQALVQANRQLHRGEWN
ncbi:hypothetical protein [Sediminicurvatus halobius]|nr:hypothetical protein [Spiribacter halobius]UEX78212.1 hypothetical protein LMH63_00795 [Spiribacter halobius]